MKRRSFILKNEPTALDLKKIQFLVRHKNKKDRENRAKTCILTITADLELCDIYQNKLNKYNNYFLYRVQGRIH